MIVRLLALLPHIPPDLILPRILAQNTHLQPIHNDLRRLLQFLVSLTPISCIDILSHSFCHLSGAWPHHARSSTGIPVARGLVDHPHPQHPHIPHPPYLSHPAFYSPIPHPGMLYPYMAPHPYPVLPDPPSRKRPGPEETQTSRGKRKRSNARDTVESKRYVSSECTLASRVSHRSKRIAARLQREQAEPGSADRCPKWYAVPWVSRASSTDFGLCH